MGVSKYGKPVGLDDSLKVDLLVIGSVAVDPATGARLGKGEVGKRSHMQAILISRSLFFINVQGLRLCVSRYVFLQAFACYLLR